MKQLILFTTLAGVLWSGTSTSAQSDNLQNGPLSRVGVSYRSGFNGSASFKNVGGLNLPADPDPVPGGGVDRFYDDGYVRVDSSGNAGGETWFWGYQSASQLPGDGTIVMRRTAAAGGLSRRDIDDDPQHGFELTYNLEWPVQALRGFLGIEAAFNFMDLQIADRQPLTGNTIGIADAFPLNSIVPPLAPYAGTREGPGPSIGATPVPSVMITPGGATVTGARRIDASLYGLRLGPNWRLPLSRRVSVSLGGGLALAVADSRFSFRETVTLAGGGFGSSAGSDGRAAWLAGGYLSGSVALALDRAWAVVAGVQYQNLGAYSHRAGARSATVDLGESVFLTGGINFTF
ncbi:MAG: hypothetical protein FJ387_30470 [Verrucomicrobia bacterium]|nr:hypothetical protein [Verrucomicrobiota bacterium]